MQGHFKLVTGPVKSEKTTILEALLNSAQDGKLMDREPFLIVKHPKDDPKQPDHIGKHFAHSLTNPSDVAKLLNEEHRHVIIAGISHYESSDIVDVVDGLVRSNRNVVASGLNLDSKGAPYNNMPSLMSLADDIILTKAICNDNRCFREDAIRSIEIGTGKYEPRCLHHFNYPGSPRISSDVEGAITIFAGPMFASKSVKWNSIIKRKKAANVPYEVFTWINNSRYGKNLKKKYVFDIGEATLNNKETVTALLVNSADDITEYLKRKPEIRDVFIDEVMFLDIDYVNGNAKTSMSGMLNNLSSQGYRFYMTGLPRNFKREPFLEMPKLMCLATDIQMSNAYCVVCASPSTENQRMKLTGKGNYVVANYDDPIVAPGGAKDEGADEKEKQVYEARCLEHFELPGAPKPKYEFPKWSPLA